VAQPIQIAFDQSRAFEAGDTLRLTIDSVAQPDRVSVWSAERAKIGFGHRSFGFGAFGFGRSLGFGIGLFGLGVFGQGIRRGVYLTQNSFVAGDYSVLADSFDPMGNQGGQSSSVTVRHRPPPPKPTSLLITGGNLTWTWSDP